MPKKKYSRDELLAVCEQAFVPQAEWTNRDSSDAQRQLGHCYALLRAGCEFAIDSGNLKTDSQTIWVAVTWKGFAHLDYGGDLDSETFYLPTRSRLDATKGKDWY